jgi:endonuclease YncB( thermonuclease family)
MILVLLMPMAAAHDASGVVTRVLDGDTIEVQDISRIRLADVDIPETNRPCLRSGLFQQRVQPCRLVEWHNPG